MLLFFYLEKIKFVFDIMANKIILNVEGNKYRSLIQIYRIYVEN